MGISDTLAGALSTVKDFIIVDSERVKKYLSKEIEFTQAIGAGSDKQMDKLRKLASEKLSGDYIIYGTFQKITFSNDSSSAEFELTVFCYWSSILAWYILE